MKIRFFNRFILFLTKHTFIAILGAGVFTAAYAYNLASDPVFFVKASNWHFKKNGVQAEIKGFKFRNCKMLLNEEKAYLYYPNDNIWHKTKFIFLEEDKKTKQNYSKSSSIYRINYGIWFWEVNQVLKPTKAMLSVFHDCGDLQPVRTNIKFDIK